MYLYRNGSVLSVSLCHTGLGLTQRSKITALENCNGNLEIQEAGNTKVIKVYFNSYLKILNTGVEVDL